MAARLPRVCVSAISLPSMPSESFAAAVPVNRDRESVWAALQVPETWEGVPGVGEVTSPTYDESGNLAGFDFSTRIGGRPYRGRAIRAERIEGQRISWKIKSSELAGQVSVDLADSGSSTDLEIALEVESAGFLASMFFPVIVGTIGEGFSETAAEFARGLESA